MATDSHKSALHDLAQALRRLLGGKPSDSGGESLGDALHRRGLIGCIEDGPSDLSTNPKYMEGFGESDSADRTH